MKGYQINFFILPEELQELSMYLIENQLIILNNKKEITDIYDSSFKYLIKSNQHDLVIETKNNTIDDLRSPVIEFWESQLNPDENTMRRGRLYYNTDFFDSTGTLIEKNNEFIESAQNLFKWFRKTFKNSKIDSWKGFFISQKTALWIQTQNGKIIDL